MKRPLILALTLAAAAPVAHAQVTNIDADNKFSWGENIGFMNWRDADNTAAGVHFYPTHAQGAIWCENVGWIRMGSGPADGVTYTNADDTDYGVNVSPSGKLFGYGWGENIGWVNFDGGGQASPAQTAYIDNSLAPRRLFGYAWSENVGWINLNDEDAYVGVYCLADFNADGFVSGDDFDAFVERFEAGDPSADVNGDTFTSGDDFDLFVAAFEAGC